MKYFVFNRSILLKPKLVDSKEYLSGASKNQAFSKFRGMFPKRVCG